MTPILWMSLWNVVTVVLVAYFAFTTYFLMTSVISLTESIDYHMTRSAHPIVRIHLDEIEKRLQDLDGLKAQPWPPAHEPVRSAKKLGLELPQGSHQQRQQEHRDP